MDRLTCRASFTPDTFNADAMTVEAVISRFRDALFVQPIMKDADNHVAMDERLTTGAA